MSKDKKTLIILDANALIHRAFHALPEFRTPKGDLVNAVYGFTSILLKVFRELKPDYVAATFDVPGPTFREEVYEEYKAQRPKAPDELYAQIPRVQEVLRAFNIRIFEKEGFEADDLIGTIAKQAHRAQAYPALEVIIVSGDMDTLQLVDSGTKVYTMRKGIQDTVMYDTEAVKKRFGGLRPEQMNDYKGLRGDPSDNIPGIRGVGEKTAVQLLTDFGNMEKMYDALEKNSKKFAPYSKRMRDLILESKDQAFFSRELATIERDVPLEFSLEDLVWKNFDVHAAQKLFLEFGFRSLVARLPGSNEKLPNPTYEKIEQLYKEGVFSRDVYELEKKLAPVLRAMEEVGIKIDKPYFFQLRNDIEKELGGLEAKIYKIAGSEFNINSPQQLSEVLFAPAPGGLGLSIKGLKKTPGGVVSTAAPELTKLHGKHAIIKELLQYRELQKLYSTYVGPLPESVDTKGRVHTKFDQLGTATGRLSSSSPNLQNIPARGEWGVKIRKGFIPERGFQFIAFDYSQMELRLAAHIANDAKMKEFFDRREDIHTMTAAEVFGVRASDVTSQMRFRAKALNFGVLYGMGATGFALSANISRDEAQIFIDNYFVRFPAIRNYIEKTKELARKNGYVETIMGRKRYIPEMNSSHAGLRAQAERMAVNHPIQGSSADIIKMAMVEISDQLRVANCRLLLQIHDELLFEVADGKIEETYPSIKDIMENVYKLSVPLDVDVSVGPSWGELKAIK